MRLIFLKLNKKVCKRATEIPIYEYLIKSIKNNLLNPLD